MKLETQTRQAGGDLTKLRERGSIPLVSYGPKNPSTPLVAKAKDFRDVYKEAGETSVVTIDAGDGPVDALIHDVDIHPTTGEPIHADFYIMEKGKAVEVSVPLAFEGEAPAVKDEGGTLVKVLHDVHVSALPKEIPDEIVVDISVLENVDDHILVSNLSTPSGVEITTEKNETVASISVEEEEPEEEEQEPADLDSIEVESKGKDPEEGEDESEEK